MKIKTIVVASLLLAFGLLVGTSTQAQVVKGEIKVAGAKTPGFTGLKCGNIVVEVESRERIGKPALTPKWQRHARATGDWASGSCGYEVKVVPNSFFHMFLGAETTQAPCNGGTTVTSTPARANGLKVMTGHDKTQDFKIDSIQCIPIK